MVVGSASFFMDTSDVPPQHKCKYKTGKCSNERSSKRNGQPHMLCLYHREKANKIQRKFDRQKRQSARMKKTSDGDSARLSLAAASVFSDDEPTVHHPPVAMSFAKLLGQEAEIYSDSESSRLSTDSEASSVALEQVWHGMSSSSTAMASPHVSHHSVPIPMDPAYFGGRFHGSAGQLSHEEIDFLYAAMLG